MKKFLKILCITTLLAGGGLYVYNKFIRDWDNPKPFKNKQMEITQKKNNEVVKNQNIFEYDECPLGYVKKGFPSLEDKYKLAPDLTNLSDDFITYEKFKFYPERRDFIFDKLCTMEECYARDNIEKGKVSDRLANDELLSKNRDINYKNQQILSEKDEVNRKNKLIQKEKELLTRYDEIVHPTAVIKTIYDVGNMSELRPRIFADPAFPSYYRPIMEETSLSKEWDYYLRDSSVFSNWGISVDNEETDGYNDHVKERNQRVLDNNKKIEEKNQRLLSEFKSYLTEDVLRNLLKDHHNRLDQYCITCDEPETFITVDTTCQKCPNREWKKLPDTYKGYCRLKKGER